MDLTFLTPALGVVVGWLLSELSSLIRSGKTSRRELGRTLTGLLAIRHQMLRLRLVTDQMKNLLPSWNDFENQRISLKRRALVAWEKDASLRELTLDILSGHAPLEAYRLRTILDSHEFSLKTTLEKTLKSSEEAYVMLLSAYEAGLDLSIQEIDALIQKIAAKRGVIWAIRFRRERQKREEYFKSNIDFVSKFGEEAYGLVQSKDRTV